MLWNYIFYFDQQVNPLENYLWANGNVAAGFYWPIKYFKYQVYGFYK